MRDSSSISTMPGNGYFAEDVSLLLGVVAAVMSKF